MLFNSFQFLLFFPLVTAVYFLLPHRWRWLHLLVASCVFYMAFIPVYILILGFTIVIDYIAGIWIEKSTGARRKTFLVLSIAANVLTLCIFKYFNFFISNVNELLDYWHLAPHHLPLLSLILPVGLSFHTFQAMSYTIEVYRGKQKAERHFGIYALYVMFYPQLAAGPIERPQNMLHQFHEKHFFNPDAIAGGLKLMLWGFFMKLVVADRLGIYVEAVYGNSSHHHGNSLLLATFFFAFQLYCDFAGYSLIAIGSAKTMGFDLMTNFRRPYFSRSVAEFWSRWHISLSTWFRDYVYIPLGGNRTGIPRWYFNLLVVFLLSGLWHGANWTYVMWGAINGILLIAEILLGKILPSLNSGNSLLNFIRKSFQLCATFIFILLGWVFFRSGSVTEAYSILWKVVTDRGPLFIPDSGSGLFYCFPALAMLLMVEACQEFFPGSFKLFNNRHKAIRYSAYAVVVVTILLLGVFDSSQFIYFQF